MHGSDFPKVLYESPEREAVPGVRLTHLAGGGGLFLSALRNGAERGGQREWNWCP